MGVRNVSCANFHFIQFISSQFADEFTNLTDLSSRPALSLNQQNVKKYGNHVARYKVSRIVRLCDQKMDVVSDIIFLGTTIFDTKPLNIEFRLRIRNIFTVFTMNKRV